MATAASPRRSIVPHVDWPALIHPRVWRSIGNVIRIEEYTEDGSRVVRAELPGIDPDKDLELTVHNHVLTIKAERVEDKTEKDRSEFSYGVLVREVALPQEVSEDDVTASYSRGVLTVRIRLAEPQSTGRRIPITSSN